jgi:hypothetical protein
LALAALILLAGVACACEGVRSAVATVVPAIPLTLTTAGLPPLTQQALALHIPTPYALPPTSTPIPTTPSSTTSSSPTNPPSPVSTPTIGWLTRAIQLEAPFGNKLGYWVDNRIVKTYDEDTIYLADTTSGVVSTPSYVPLLANVQQSDESLSPEEKFALLCDEKVLKLYRLSDNQLVSKTPTSIGPGGCSMSARWSSDSTAVAFVSMEGDVYIWQTDGSAPYQVGKARNDSGIRWSPDGTRLSVTNDITHNEVYSGETLVAYDGCRFDVVNRSGKPATVEGRFTGAQLMWPYVDWLSNSILVFHGQVTTLVGSDDFFSVVTGKYLTSWGYDYGFPMQEPVVSPDGNWIGFDGSCYQVYFGEGGNCPYYEYSLFDVHRPKQSHTLSTGEEIYLSFTSWADDSSALYLISRPVSATAKSNVQTPFGLLALNPRSLEFTPLLPKAVFASFSPDKKASWVLVPARQADGTIGLDGEIFSLDTKTITGRQSVSSEMIYANPAEGDLVPVTWSNSGHQVVFGTSNGEMWVTDLQGRAYKLAERLPLESWRQARYVWSPDNRHLLVEFGGRAWVLDIPASS